MSYPTVLAIILVLGLIPALLYLALHRLPRSWRSIVAFDASFWVVVVVGIYGWSLYRLFTAPGSVLGPSVRGWDGEEVWAIVLGGLLDVALWARLWHWVARGRRKAEVPPGP